MESQKLSKALPCQNHASTLSASHDASSLCAFLHGSSWAAAQAREHKTLHDVDSTVASVELRAENCVAVVAHPPGEDRNVVNGEDRNVVNHAEVTSCVVRHVRAQPLQKLLACSSAIQCAFPSGRRTCTC